MRASRHYGCDVGVWCCGRPKFTMAVGDAGVATGYGFGGLRRWWWSVWWDVMSKNGLKGCLRGSRSNRGYWISGVGRVGRGLGRSGIRRGCEDSDGRDAGSISDAGAGMSRSGRDMTPAHTGSTGTGWPPEDSRSLRLRVRSRRSRVRVTLPCARRRQGQLLHVYMQNGRGAVWSGPELLPDPGRSL